MGSFNKKQKESEMKSDSKKHCFKKNKTITDQVIELFLPGISNDQTAKDSSNSSTRSSHSNGGSSSSNELGSSVDVTAHCAGLEASQTHLSEGRLGRQSSRNLKRKGSTWWSGTDLRECQSNMTEMHPICYCAFIYLNSVCMSGHLLCGSSHIHCV